MAMDMYYYVLYVTNLVVMDWTPKHIGIASTSHQEAMSKILVTVSHNASHSISYKDVLKIRTALTKHTYTDNYE